MLYSVKINNNNDINRAMDILYWCGQNLENDIKYKLRQPLSGSVTLEFTINGDEDYMAFKLRWS